MVFQMPISNIMNIWILKNKKRARIEIQPRFKIQYPMKNRYEYRVTNTYLSIPFSKWLI